MTFPTPPVEPDAVDQIYTLLDDIEAALAEVRELAHEMTEGSADD